MDKVCSDKTALAISSAMWGSYGAFAVAAPKKFEDTFFVDTAPKRKELSRWFGYALLTSAGAGVVGALSNDADTRRNMMALHAGAHMACAGMNAYNAHKGTQEKKGAYASAGLGVATAGLMVAKIAYNCCEKDKKK